MKLVLVVLLAIVATAKSQACEPNSVYKMDCNTCFCSEDGQTAACTLMLCPPKLELLKDNIEKRSIESEETRQACVPGTTYKNYCNTCTCLDNGLAAACTLMACNPLEWNQDGTKKV